MSKKVFNILSAIAIVLVLLFIVAPETYAMKSADEMHQQATEFIDKGAASAKIDVNKIAGVMKPLASLLLGIGTVVLVIVTAVMGVKYMAATPDTRAKLKGQLVGIAVSAIVLFGAYGIWSIAYTILSDITA